MSVIVSANYRDRDQKNWLVRNAHDSIETYHLRERVVIKDFMFCQSYAGEEGFGCKMVAQGELEGCAVDSEKLVRIRFDGVQFVEDQTGKHIAGGRALVLDDTGMYYLPA